MKRLQLLVASALVGVAVALTYFYFEAAAHDSIDLVWNDWLNTGSSRWLVIPICLILSLIFFGLQHYIDPRSEKHESEGLGDMPKPTIGNLAKVLFIGFWSLVAGASLGPEAILVPACMLIGGLAGAYLFKHNDQAVKLLAAIGLISLMTAFFHSIIAGLLSLLLIKKQTKARLGMGLIVLAVVASVVTVWVLGQLTPSPFISLPPTNWHFNVRSLMGLLVLLAGGYLITYAIGGAHKLAEKLHQHISTNQWWVKALIAASGLSLLYLLGGSLVEFTGNQSIVPMLEQAGGLGVLGLVWIVSIKVIAISWSKAMGYRGGMVFPTVFVASVLVAIAQVYFHDLNFIYGLIVVMAGALAGDRRVKILL